MDNDIKEFIKSTYQQIINLNTPVFPLSDMVYKEVRQVAVIMYLLTTRSTRRKMDKAYFEILDEQIDWIGEIRKIEVDHITDYLDRGSEFFDFFLENKDNPLYQMEDAMPKAVTLLHQLTKLITLVCSYPEDPNCDERFLFMDTYYHIFEERAKEYNIWNENGELGFSYAPIEELEKKLIEARNEVPASAYAPVKELTKEENARFRKMYREFIKVCNEGKMKEYREKKIDTIQEEVDLVDILNQRLEKIEKLMM